MDSNVLCKLSSRLQCILLEIIFILNQQGINIRFNIEKDIHLVVLSEKVLNSDDFLHCLCCIYYQITFRETPKIIISSLDENKKIIFFREKSKGLGKDRI